MAIELTIDPIVTIQECKDILGWNDDSKTRVLINSVSAKFLKFTNRVRINEAAVEELTRAVDHQLVWARATPIAAGEVKIEVLDNEGATTETYSTTDGTLVVDRNTGKIARPGCQAFPSFCNCSGYPADGIPSIETNRSRGEEVPFPSLKLTYTGGWPTVPGDLVMSAFEQAKLELERLKGNTGITADSKFGDQVAFQSEDLTNSVESVWKRYRI